MYVFGYVFKHFLCCADWISQINGRNVWLFCQYYNRSNETRSFSRAVSTANERAYWNGSKIRDRSFFYSYSLCVLEKLIDIIPFPNFLTVQSWQFIYTQCLKRQMRFPKRAHRNCIKCLKTGYFLLILSRIRRRSHTYEWLNLVWNHC